MWFSTHALCVMALSTTLSNPLWLAVTATASHFVLDLVPHEDVPTPLLAGVDVSAGILIGITLWFAYSPGLLFLWGALWAVLPDAEVLLQERGYLSRRFFPSHLPRLHGVLRGKWGVAANCISAVLFFLLFLILH